MLRKALIVPASSLAIAAGVVCSLAVVRGSGAVAETTAGYPSVSTQLFDSAPIGGELRPLAPTGNSSAGGWDTSVKAQIFDPGVLGSHPSTFFGTRSIAGNSGAAQSTLEGRSVGVPVQHVPVSAPVREMSPGQPRECEPRPSAQKIEPQFGSLDQNYAAG